MQTTIPRWASRPLFISSTFSDMHAERDYLHTVVFPELKECLLPTHCHIEPIDLRWGTVRDAFQEESLEFAALTVCLAEVKRSAPYFICILGDRYGWIPPYRVMRLVADQAGYQGDVTGMSVTELEIQLGALSSPQCDAKVRFYIREPLPADKMPPEQRMRYVEDNPRNKMRLRQLKAELSSIYPGRVRQYATVWDEATSTVAGLEDFGRYVLSDLLSDLQDEKEGADGPGAGSKEESDREAVDALIESKTHSFVGRSTEIKQLLSHLLSADHTGTHWGECIVGEVGSGKSSLMAQLAKGMHTKDVLVLIHIVDPAIPSWPLERILLNWCRLLATFLGTDLSVDEQSACPELEHRFCTLLADASAKKRVAVLLDGLDALESSSRARHFLWRPKPWPRNARFVATTAACQTVEVLSATPGMLVQRLEGLDIRAATQMLCAICRRYGRDPDSRIVEILLDKKRYDGTASYQSPMWLELAGERINLLGENDYRFADEVYEGPYMTRVASLLRKTALEIPPELNELRLWLIRNAQSQLGEWVNGCMIAISIGRIGWRDTELRALARNLTGLEWDLLQFARLRRALLNMVMQRDECGRWTCYETLGELVLSHLGESAGRHTIHRLTADFLSMLPADDGTRCSEMMFHLIGAEDWDRACNYLASVHSDDSATSAATDSLAEYIDSVDAASRERHIRRVVQMLVSPRTASDTVPVLAHAFVYLLVPTLTRRGNRSAAFTVLKAAADALDNIGPIRREAQSWIAHTRANTHKTLGDFHCESGENQQGTDEYQRCIECLQEVAECDPHRRLWELEIAKVKCQIGDMKRNTGGLREALDAYNEYAASANAGAKRVRGTAKDFWRIHQAHAYELIGSVMEEMGKPQDALDAYKRCRSVSEELVASASMIDYYATLGRSLRRIYHVLNALGRNGEARQSLQYLGEVLQKTAAIDFDDSAQQRELVESKLTIGHDKLRNHEYHVAADHYRTALEIAMPYAVLETDSDDWHLLRLRCHQMLAEALRRFGDCDEAYAACTEEIAYAQKLAIADKANTERQHSLFLAFMRMGHIQKPRGDRKDAVVSFNKALEIIEGIVAEDEDNPKRNRDFEECLESVGDVLMEEGSTEQALSVFERRAAILETLYETDRDIEILRSLGANCGVLCELIAQKGDLPRELEAYRTAVAVVGELSEIDDRKVRWLAVLSSGLSRIGDLLLRHGEEEEAIRAYKDALGKAEVLRTYPDGVEEAIRDIAYINGRLSMIYIGSRQAQKASEYIRCFRESFRDILELNLTPDDDTMRTALDLGFFG